MMATFQTALTGISSTFQDVAAPKEELQFAASVVSTYALTTRLNHVAIQCDHTDKSLQRQQKDRADAKYLQRTWGKDVFVVNHRRGDSEVILHGARLAKERHLDIFECTLPSKAARVPKWSASNKNLIENR